MGELPVCVMFRGVPERGHVSVVCAAGGRKVNARTSLPGRHSGAFPYVESIRACAQIRCQGGAIRGHGKW